MNIEKLGITLGDIRLFLIKANQNGYGNPDVERVPQPDSSTTIVYKEGDWLCHDNYFGGEPYAGRLVISYKQSPVWAMIYYGAIEDLELAKPENRETVYTFLCHALVAPVEHEIPVRGPARHEEGEWLYISQFQGDLFNFTGQEAIFKNDPRIYIAQFYGGLIDQ